MSERGLEFKVGLFILISSAILVGFIFVLGNVSLHSGVAIQIDYDYIGALQVGAPVKVSGIKVGKIDSIDFYGGKLDPQVGNQRVQVRVTAWIEERAREAIRSDAEFYINTAGVLGEQYLEIVPGSDWNQPAIAPHAIIHGAPAVHDPPRTDLVVARLYEVLDGASQVLHDDKDAIKHLLSNGANAVASLNQLLSDRRAQIGELIDSTAQLAKTANVTLGKVNAGLGNGAPVASLLGDADGALKAAQSSLAAITPPAQSFLAGASRVTGLITADRVDQTLAVADKAATMASKAGGFIDNLNALVTGLRAGHGTVGALLSRDDIYSDVREMIRDLKRNPWKFLWKE